METQTEVFSAHAEVVPAGVDEVAEGSGILRARGGSSAEQWAGEVAGEYSPRTRR